MGYYAEMLPEASGRGPSLCSGPRPLREPAAGGDARTPAASPSNPASKHNPLAPESPGWASQSSPICGMRTAPPRYYNLGNVEPGASISPLLRPPGFPIGSAPALLVPAFLMYGIGCRQGKGDEPDPGRAPRLLSTGPGCLTSD